MSNDPPGDLRHIVNDVTAGWIGGVAGILSSNFLDVWKVRQQTQLNAPQQNNFARLASFAVPSPGWTASSILGRGKVNKYYLPPRQVVYELAKESQRYSAAVQTAKSGGGGLIDAFRQEGISLLFRGAMGPILGHAFIDAALFGIYGQFMELFGQDRQNPDSLLKVGMAGAFSGGLCTFLETPIEVVKVRVQQSHDNVKGTLQVTSDIAKHDGLKGFYVGGVATAVRESLGAGLFFATYFACRKLIETNHPEAHLVNLTKDEHASLSSESLSGNTASSGETAPVEELLIASAVAGVISNLIPYPIDVIKTHIQTADPSKGPIPNIRQAARDIYRNAQSAAPRLFETSWVYRWVLRHIFAPDPGGPLLPDGRHRPHPYAARLSIRILGLSGFFRGLVPTLAGGLVYSAVMMTTFEKALALLQSI